MKGASINSGYVRLRCEICHIKAQIARNSSAIAKICNAEMAGFGLKMLVHELVESPFSSPRSEFGNASVMVTFTN